MMHWVAESSIKLRFLIAVLTVMLLVFGLLQLRQMPVDIYPEVSPPHVEIQTEALGLSAAEVEAFLTVPMEADLLNGVAWLDRIYSESVAGLSSIFLVFEPGTDPIRARQMVQERLTQAHALPNVSQPPVMIQPLSSSNRIMMVGLSSSELSMIELGVLSRWNIKPRLLGVSGVANVAIWGQRERQLQVQVDPAKLHEQGVTLRQIVETTGEALWVSPLSYLEASAPGSSGWIDTPNQRLTIRHLLPISSPEDLAQVAVAGAPGMRMGDGAPGIRLGDVATVVEDHQPLIGDAALANGPGMILVIEKFPGASTLEVTKGVEKALQDLQPGLTGVEIDTGLFRPANYIESAVNNMSRLLLIGLVLAVLVFFIFYREWRVALIGLVALASSLIAAGLILYIGGATFNMMMWAGIVLALAIVIDDVVIHVDSISRQFHAQAASGSDSVSINALVHAAIMELRTPLSFAFLIVLLLAVPIFFLPGLSGAFFQPLIFTYLLAIVVSLLVALIITPAISVSLLSGASMRQSPVAEGVQRLYQRMLGRTGPSARLMMIMAALLIVLGLALLPFMEVSLLPPLQQDSLLIRLESISGTSGMEMTRISAQASEELRSIPGVLNVGSHVGRAITGDVAVGINSGEIWLSLDPAADYDAMAAAIREVMDGYPGLLYAVQDYRPEELDELLQSVDNSLIVRVYGHELTVLRDIAQNVAASIANIDGIVGTQPILYEEEPQVDIVVNLAAAEEHGIKPGDVRRQATTLLSGIHVGDLFEDQKVFDVMVWGVPEIRSDLTRIKELLIDTPSGNQIALGEVADVNITPAATVIQRDAVSRYVDVVASIEGRSFDAVSADIQNQLQGLDIPLEFHTEVLNSAQGLQTTRLRLLAIVIAALLGVYLLMQAALSSWRLSFALFLTLPVALVGGVVAVFISGGVLSTGSLFGFLTVLALAVRNILVLGHRLQVRTFVEAGNVNSEGVIQGAQERVIPLVTTALATAAALLPFLFGGNIAGNELVWPMVVVILGGLVTSTLSTLFVLPAFFILWPSTPAPETAPVLAQPALETV
ncbi:MAG: efflux RND transporter permease subunit [Caldilineaceae bacterium]|nr:efflux RND transporter permease subunit [Caldilineaceae bacterium]